MLPNIKENQMPKIRYSLADKTIFYELDENTFVGAFAGCGSDSNDLFSMVMRGIATQADIKAFFFLGDIYRRKMEDGFIRIPDKEYERWQTLKRKRSLNDRESQEFQKLNTTLYEQTLKNRAFLERYLLKPCFPAKMPIFSVIGNHCVECFKIGPGLVLGEKNADRAVLRAKAYSETVTRSEERR